MGICKSRMGKRAGVPRIRPGKKKKKVKLKRKRKKKKRRSMKSERYADLNILEGEGVPGTVCSRRPGGMTKEGEAKTGVGNLQKPPTWERNEAMAG